MMIDPSPTAPPRPPSELATRGTLAGGLPPAEAPPTGDPEPVGLVPDDPPAAAFASAVPPPTGTPATVSSRRRPMLAFTRTPTVKPPSSFDRTRDAVPIPPLN